MRAFGGFSAPVVAAAAWFSMGLAATASTARAETDVAKGCEGLSSAIKSEFSIPYKPVKGRLSVSCVNDASVSLGTMHFFVAAAFYHDDTELRKKAIRKLSGYKCPGKDVCKELDALVETHAKAAARTRPDAWAELEADVSDLRSALKAGISE